MNLKKIFNFNNIGSVSDTYAIACTNYTNDGYMSNTKLTENGFISVHDEFTVTGKITEDNDVFLREDTITNTGDEPLTLYDYKSRFCLSGEEYEVYTLYNNWQNESCGAWQDLNTTVVASAKGIRTNDCNVPMLAIYNKQTHRGIVFHVFPTAAWSITASKRSPSNRLVYTIIDIALNDDALSLTINPGESFTLPTILYYEFTNKLSLDASKMHRYMAKHYPRKQMPVIYNTWLAFFDRIELNNVITQIEEAADLGCDYFTLDAGWFGDGTLWEYNIGNWTENTEGAYRGRMREVSDRVHAAGMKFGLWLEGERALAGTSIVKAHPEYFWDNGQAQFLNFGYAPARRYITDLTLDLVKQYNIDLFKFDFNDTIIFDQTHKAFTEYHAGYNTYLKDIRSAYPNIYLECCAAGGYRTNLETMKYFDSYWFTDNQSLYDGIDIYKNAIYHILPSTIEKWAALSVCDGFLGEYSDANRTKRLMSTDNATWSRVISTTPEYLKGFFLGGPIGITCDLTKLDSETKDALKKIIVDYKAEAPFWTNATCKLLIDTERILAMQYENGDTVKIVIFTKIVTQSSISVYPILKTGTYICGNEVKTATEWSTQGFEIQSPTDKNAYIYTFKKA